MIYAPVSESVTGNALPVITASAYTSGDFEYTINNNVTISKYIGEGGDVVIPSIIDDKKVTGIGHFAF